MAQSLRPLIPAPRPLRRAFTLIEITLTLAVMVVIAALVMPTLTKPFAVERLKKAADLVRSEWTRARVAAMSSGTTHVFIGQPEASTYQVQVWAGGDAEVESSGPATVDVAATAPLPGTDRIENATPGMKQLPEDIKFVSGQSALDARATQAAAEAGQTLTAAALPPVFFYPDGTASDASLVLRNEHGVSVQLDLRGLTGVVTVSDPFTSGVTP